MFDVLLACCCGDSCGCVPCLCNLDVLSLIIGAGVGVVTLGVGVFLGKVLSL